MRLLIIDDEPHIRQMMRLTLEAAGYQVDEAADGQAGVEQFRAGPAYDAVLLDQRMPGLDGLETLRRLKEDAPDVCVLIVTAFGSIELAVDAMRLGATDFLRKPMTPDTLRGAVGAAIASKSAREPRSRAAASRRSGPAEIVIQTLNGFQILPLAQASSPPGGHLFRLRHLADGVESDVTVTVDAEAVDRVARLTHRRLEPGGAFWHLQAERLLSGYVWVEGHPPPDGTLIVHDLAREDLDLAARWEES